MQLASTEEPAYAPLETTDLSRFASAPVDAGAWGEQYATTTPEDAVWEIAQGCLDEVGGVWLQRNPTASDDTFAALAQSDARLLRQFDGVISLGAPLLDRLQERIGELTAPDEWFAHLFCLANLREPRGRALILDTLAQLEGADREVREACAEALAMSAHPALASLEAASPAVPEAHGVLLHALALRGELTPAAVITLLAGSPSHAAVLGPLALGLLTAKVDPVDCHRALLPLLSHENEEVLSQALVTGAVRGIPEAYSRAIALCDEKGPAFADAAFSMVLHGRAQTGERLMRMFVAAPSAALAHALGRHGSPDVVPFLIDQLDVEGVAADCAAALHMVTGASLLEDRLISVFADDERVYADAPDAKVSVKELTLDKALWRAYWATAEAGLASAPRVRFGRPLGVAVLRLQLEHGPGEFASRAATALELCALAGAQVPVPLLWVRDLYARQRRALAWLDGSPSAEHREPYART